MTAIPQISFPQASGNPLKKSAQRSTTFKTLDRILNTDWVGRAAIASTVSYVYGPVIGIAATALAFGLEKGMQWMGKKTFQLVQSYVADKPILSAETLKKTSEAALPPLSIGIPNGGNTCFINAGLQSTFIDSPILEKALEEEAAIGGDTKEVGQFLQAYRRDQANKLPYCTSGSGASIRTTLWRLSGNDAYLRGQHDPWEMRRLILNEPALSDRLRKEGFYGRQTMRRYYDTRGLTPMEGASLKLDREKGFYYSSRTEEDSGEIVIHFPPRYGRPMPIQALLINSLQGQDECDPPKHKMTNGSFGLCDLLYYEKEWDRVPEELVVWVSRFGSHLVQQKDARLIEMTEAVSIPKTCFRDRQEREYHLVSFIEHQGQSKHHGHYVSYKKENGKYYQFDDRVRTEISQAFFLEKAKGAYGLKYVKAP